jgi:hypothetical protein
MSIRRANYVTSGFDSKGVAGHRPEVAEIGTNVPMIGG